MTTLRGAVGQSYTGSTNTITLPAGSVAGDWALLCVGNANNFTSLTSITNWTRAYIERSSSGENRVYVKQLTAADITTGSVTVNWSGSGGGHTAIATALASAGVMVRRFSADTIDSTFTTGRTLTFDVKNGMVGIYLGQKRKDTVTPAVSFNIGTLDNATAVANYAGAIAHTAYGSDQSLTLTSTWDSAGQSEFIVAAVFADTFGGSTDTSLEFAGAPAGTSMLYKGRATATDDQGAIP